MSAEIFSWVWLAGPSVQTIFVRLTMVSLLSGVFGRQLLRWVFVNDLELSAVQ